MKTLSNKIKCLECNTFYGTLISHVKVHNLTPQQYKTKHPGAEIVSNGTKEKHSKRMREGYEKNTESYKAVAGSRTFDFVEKKKLKTLLQRDYKSAKTCLQQKLWKPSIILYGSLIEAILVEQTKSKTFKEAIEKSYNREFISEKEYHKIHLVKNLRNFVHIHAELSEGEEINEHWAKTFADICESIISRFRYKKP